MTVASRLIWGAADGPEEWSPAGTHAALGRGCGHEGWPALGRVLGQGMRLERSEQCQEFLTLAVEGAWDSVLLLARR